MDVQDLSSLIFCYEVWKFALAQVLVTLWSWSPVLPEAKDIISESGSWRSNEHRRKSTNSLIQHRLNLHIMKFAVSDIYSNRSIPKVCGDQILKNNILFCKVLRWSTFSLKLYGISYYYGIPPPDKFMENTFRLLLHISSFFIGAFWSLTCTITDLHALKDIMHKQEGV